MHSLHKAMADLIQYLGPQDIAAEIFNKLELVYGTMASFNILMQTFCKLQQGKMENMTLHVTWLEGVLNVVQQEYLLIMSASVKVQQVGRFSLC